MAEQYALWKKSSWAHYDLVISHNLEWPSLTVQWLPRAHCYRFSSPLVRHPLLLGTDACGPTLKRLMVVGAYLPASPNHAAHPLVGAPPIPAVSVSQRIRHRGRVNRSRHMPQKPAVVATKTRGCKVRVFLDVERQVWAGRRERPDLVLKGHKLAGYELDWKPKEGLLLSGSDENLVCMWDVAGNGVSTSNNTLSTSNNTLDARNVFVAHQDSVEDVAWHVDNENLFGSVGDDHMLMMWDLRTSTPIHPQISIMAHQHEVNSLSFSPFNERILATGSVDATVKLFDLRKLTTSLHTFSSHSKAVVQVELSPQHEMILASSSADTRLMIWDLSKIGDENTKAAAKDGPPELLFVYRGHTGAILEFSWNPSEQWMIASVAEDKIHQIWLVVGRIFGDWYNKQDEGDIYAAT